MWGLLLATYIKKTDLRKLVANVLLTYLCLLCNWMGKKCISEPFFSTSSTHCRWWKQVKMWNNGNVAIAVPLLSLCRPTADTIISSCLC